MKLYLLLFLLPFFMGCQKKKEQKINGDPMKSISQSHGDVDTKGKPKVSFTFDDGITTDLATYPFEDWNQLILEALEDAHLTSTFFVTGANKTDEKGVYLLQSWVGKGHQIANHTFSHPNFNSEKKTIDDFEMELLTTDSILAPYETFTPLFRFPYLKEGNTEEKISGFRNILKKHGYKNGHVTIDASDWYVNSKLLEHIREEGADSPKIKEYKQFYLQHILERAKYYEKLSFQLTGRHISHTLLLHHNLTSALFLKDLMQRFTDEGWELIDSKTAFKDEIYTYVPKINPAGESLIWAMAKETGRYSNQLRYPAEDSRYEKPKMEKMGL